MFFAKIGPPLTPFVQTRSFQSQTVNERERERERERDRERERKDSMTEYREDR